MVVALARYNLDIVLMSVRARKRKGKLFIEDNRQRKPRMKALKSSKLGLSPAALTSELANFSAIHFVVVDHFHLEPRSVDPLDHVLGTFARARVLADQRMHRLV